ncbi:zinc-binding dehydrogenase [Paenibacillus sp. MMS20-IR301]|uniref:quinone oxidoreductase family protein n=1 Tax=Paenibacillus sp. MMS20-IR301 TaxID=2895946 RepID=UPI0028E884A7|nr:zinc-binding dehydrogenase [Paenibacillus sp. MMS20-IR301]WNS41049.1 zinc-binding dehydrogenase [Paenibacillus sp. MMS20-IR301]
MKAMMLRETGGPDKLKLEEVDTPSPGPKEVVVRLQAAALNRRDLLVIHGRYPGIKLPVIPGSDGAGVIVAAGDEVNQVAPGDQVIINPGLNWGSDMDRKDAGFTALGMPANGTYAGYVKVPADNAYPKPSHLSWEEAAALPLAGLTAYRALVTKGKVRQGENVLVPGAGGGVATFIVQFAAALGANVYVTSSQAEKIAKAESLGAIGGVNYKAEDWVEQLQELTGGINLSIDSIGGEAFGSLPVLGKIGSRIVSFGATRGPVPNFTLPSMTVKEISVIGSTMGSPQDFADMLKLVAEHEIHPVIDRTYPLEQAPEALLRMEAGENFGKIILTIPQ